MSFIKHVKSIDISIFQIFSGTVCQIFIPQKLIIGRRRRGGFISNRENSVCVVFSMYVFSVYIFSIYVFSMYVFSMYVFSMYSLCIQYVCIQRMYISSMYSSCIQYVCIQRMYICSMYSVCIQHFVLKYLMTSCWSTMVMDKR